MSRFHEKAEGHTRQMIGQMIGDEQLVVDGNQQLSALDDERSGQHSDHGIIKDEKAEEQPKDKERAQTVQKAEPGQHGLPTKKNVGSESAAGKSRKNGR
jgi:hypothetical protein